MYYHAKFVFLVWLQLPNNYVSPHHLILSLGIFRDLELCHLHFYIIVSVPDFSIALLPHSPSYIKALGSISCKRCCAFWSLELFIQVSR